MNLTVPANVLSCLCLYLIILVLFHVVCFCVNVCTCLSVSAENLEKSLRQMERQLLQLEKDLDTFSSPDDPSDMFFTKMVISFSH